MSSPLNIHATGLVLDRCGVLIRGPSGAGKSLLALELIASWTARGENAVLVADDRVDIIAAAGALQMSPPPALAGLIELRGRGIVSRPYVASAAVHLLVDLTERLERMPEPSAFSAEFCGMILPRCPVPRAGVVELGHQVALVREGVRALHEQRLAVRQKIA